MEIDYALILSAGLGTRMGEIGKVIPKVMWPIFGTCLIDLQINYCKMLGIKKIFINTHYKAEELENHLAKKYGDDVIILHEEPLLDSGGAIHNLASHPSVNYHGNLLMVNGDQFLLFSRQWLGQALNDLVNKRAVLFGIIVDKGEKYNETKIENGLLKSIEKSNEESSFVTYSGLGLLKLDGLKEVKGISKFFQTVTNFKEEPIGMLVPDKYEYWDFGTAEIYFKNLFKIYQTKNENKLIHRFLLTAGIQQESYEEYISREKNSIRHSKSDAFEKNKIVRGEIAQSI